MPGIALSVQVVGPMEAVLHEVEIAPLDRSEQRHVAIRIEYAGCNLEGRVSTENGEPLSQVFVELESARQDRVSTRTDRWGSVRFSYLPEGELELSRGERG